ncbi:MAG TPA: hypothetical protein VFR84_12475 [Candidatus Angelobacter sp.]|nr:hypothetical protein [Candidatus Angelobacter sp.]
MNRLSAVNAVSPAMSRVSAMLFKSFRLSTWLKMGFIGLLGGGVVAGGGNFNFRGPITRVPSTPSGGGTRNPIEELGHIFRSIHVADYVHAIMIAMIVGLALSLIFLYLFSRFRFILFDSVITQQPVVGRGWRMYVSQANRFFGFWLVFRLVQLAVILTIIGVPLWNAYKSGALSGDGSMYVLLKMVAAIALGAILASLVFAIISTLMKDFIMPIMALDNLTLGDSWSALWRVIVSEPGAWAGYLGMKLLLAIGASIALLVAGTVAVIPGFFLVGIPAGILAGIGVLVLKMTSLAAAIPIFVIAGLVAAAGICCIYMLLTAPVSVFFAAYAFYFFGGRYPKLGALLWPQPTPTAPVPQMAGTEAQAG